MNRNVADMMEINSKTHPKRSKGVVKSIEHERSSNGGHVFTHRMAHDGGNYHEPEVHTFGKDEGKKALAHFAKHSGVSSEKVEPDEDSAAGAAT